MGIFISRVSCVSSYIVILRYNLYVHVFLYNDLHPLSCQSPFHIKLCMFEPKLRPSKHNKNTGSTLLLFKCRKNTLILLEVFFLTHIKCLFFVQYGFLFKNTCKNKTSKTNINQNATNQEKKYIDVYFTFNCQPLS